MSENLWADFDEKITELSTKADELDGLRVRLKKLPDRLTLIKKQTETLLLSAKVTMSESLKKEIAKKVQALDAIFNKLQSTKDLSEPLLQKLEGELKNLEDFADSSSVKMDERAQKQSGNTLDNMDANKSSADSALFQEKRKLLDLVPPANSDYVNPIGTNTIATPAPNTTITPKQVTTTPVNKPGPPEGTKYDYLAKKAAAQAAEVAKAKAAKAAIAKQEAEVAKAKAAEVAKAKAAKAAIAKQATTTPENNNAEYFAALNTPPTTNSTKKQRAPWNSSTKVGGFLSSKKYSHKRRNRKLKSQKRAKLMKRKSKAHKKKASTRRR